MRLFAACLFALAVSAFGQDCTFTMVGRTAAGSTNSFDNRTRGCTSWIVAYSSNGFTGVSLTFQQAPDAAGTPGAWATFAGATISGANPQTTLTQNSYQGFGYAPWLRLNLAGLVGAGSVTATVYGWKQPAVSLSGGGSVSANVNLAAVGGTAFTLGQKTMAGSIGVAVASDQSNVPVSQATASALNAQVQGPGASGAALAGNPLRIGGSDGANTQNLVVCTLSAAISTSASGDTQIVALSGATRVRICHISWASASAINVKFTYGTGANCGTGTADLTGAYQNVATGALDFPVSQLAAPASQALCINLSGAVATAGVILYAQF